MTTQSEKLERAKEHYFGGCPECGDNDGYLNIERVHVFHCGKHETQWTVGSNLFSSWKRETPDVWLRNAEKLCGYREVEPLLVFDPPADPLPTLGEHSDEALRATLMVASEEKAIEALRILRKRAIDPESREWPF